MKHLLDLTVASVERLHQDYVLLRLTDAKHPLPAMLPGQFAQVQVGGSSAPFLRRPISINYIDEANNELWLLVHVVGKGTQAMAQLRVGEAVNVVAPLGRGFSLPESGKRALLVGGGVGTAPLLQLGKELTGKGVIPTFLLGARTADDLLQTDHFARFGRVFTTTEDGSQGEKGYVTNHTLLYKERFDCMATCGPKPMMMAVARYAKATDTPCEVSLENLMACGIGACLCCVEKTTAGNRCVCTEGPVFNINELTWLI